MIPEKNVTGRVLAGSPAWFLARFNWRETAQTFSITVGAIAASLALFAVYMAIRYHVAPLPLFRIIYEGSLGSKASLECTCLGAAPLILVALCTALPARVGLIIIGADGAMALGGLAAAIVGLKWKDEQLMQVLVTMKAGDPVDPAQASAAFNWLVEALATMALAGMVVGGLWIVLAGTMRYLRGVNETISSLLLSLIALGLFNFLVEGPLKDPDPISANKPSTPPIADIPLLGNMFGYDVHWGFGLGIIFCVLMWLLMYHTTFGFGARMAGGNVKAAQAAGLPVGRLLLVTCFLGGAAAGLAGSVEIAAVQLQANSSLYYRPVLTIGLLGVLISFVARHNPLAVVPVAVLIAGVLESSVRLQSQLEVFDASAYVFLGILMVMIIVSETLYGRFRVFLPLEVQKAMATK